VHVRAWPQFQYDQPLPIGRIARRDRHTEGSEAEISAPNQTGSRVANGCWCSPHHICTA